MKKTIALGLLTLVAACAGQPKETYPYGMNEKEWNELSIKDKANIRREFYFLRKKAQPLSSTRKWKLKAKNRKCP